MVSSTGHHDSIEPHRGRIQHNCRLRVSTSLPQEQLDDSSSSVPLDPTPAGKKRCRLVCGQDHRSTSKVRVLASRSGQPLHRRLHNPLEPVPLPVPQSTLEPHQSLPSEDIAGEAGTRDNDHTLVAQRSLVPHDPISQPIPASSAPSIGHRPPNTNRSLAHDKQFLETRRLELSHRTLVRALFSSDLTHSKLNSNARAILVDHRLRESPTNISYKRGQILFIQWSIYHQVSPSSFTPSDLINFLSDMHTLHSYALSTLQLFRKLAFLLGVSCFLRPSDLQRIPLSSVSLPTESTLSFEVHCPKEKRRRRRVIKSFLVKAHVEQSLCPIYTFHLLSQRRPSCTAPNLFFNSLHPTLALRTRTIQVWISNLIRLSTSEPRVSLRSIASSLALQSGIPKEDIVTMGNWASSTTFENHYRREHLSRFDFTNTLITRGDQAVEDTNEEDIFFDALDFS
ncbi:hypothetical protein CLU79DRAFT_705420 [Phycomyces nitens]|nr:hypothetical protein CLU79DRAFT_705420 [Phycomyces nitens]